VTGDTAAAATGGLGACCTVCIAGAICVAVFVTVVGVIGCVSDGWRDAGPEELTAVFCVGMTGELTGAFCTGGVVCGG